MDITKISEKIKTNKIFNGETVNYAGVFSVSLFLFLVLKQLFKTAFSLEASVSVLLAFIISNIVLFFLERKFVFFKGSNKKFVKQAILYVFRTVVDFGFYKICDFMFGNILKLGSALIFMLAIVICFVFNYYFDRLLVFDVLQKAQDAKNGRAYRLFFGNRFVLASVACAALSIGFVYIVFKMFPFGDTTVMRMDLFHQYGPLFGEFYDRITQHQSFLYSWQSGGGSGFLGNYFNYLSSPLSFLVFLFDRKEIAYAISTLVVVKGLLSAATFTYYIKKSFNRHSYASASFGVFYAFCGYFLAYYWNIMWIDAMILLPIITLGIEKIIKEGKALLYICSLTLLFFCSYYMAYMVCIYSVLYFLIYFFIHYNANAKLDETLVFSKKQYYKKLKNYRFLSRGFNFALSSLLCAGICACFLIPVYFILQACSATSDSFPTSFESYFNILDMLSSHLAGLETTIRSSGDDVLPNIYCGILTIVLVPLYMANKKIKLREKALYLLLLLFFVFSFDNNCMNFIWHAFHFPNDLPFRFSFMYSFILLVIAFRGLMHIKALEYKDIAMTGMLWILVVLIFQKFPTNKINELSIYVSLAFVIIWTGVLLLIKKGIANKFVIGITIIAMTFCEVIVADSNSYLFTQDQADYVANYDSYKEAIDYTHDKDKSFYRSELCRLDTRMDPCLYGYNGISVFSSMAYESYSQTQYSLGMFGNRINSYTYNTQTPVYNMMYNIKYVTHKDSGVEPSSKLYTEFYKSKSGDTTVYQNDYYLPIAFETSDEIKSWEVPEGNPFEVQQSFITKATGTDNVFVPLDYISSECDGVECDTISENGTFFYERESDSESFGTVNICVTPKKSGNVYVYISSPQVTNVNYYWDDNNKTENQEISEPYIMDLGYHEKGDEITIAVDCSPTETDESYFELYAYTTDKDVLDSAYELLSAGALQVESHSDTKIDGTINAGYDGFLYTSIPYDESWSVYIDGKKAQTFEIGESQLATTIQHGEHKISFRYSPKGMKYGIIISAAVWTGIGIYTVLYRIKKKKNKNLLNLNKKIK